MNLRISVSRALLVFVAACGGPTREDTNEAKVTLLSGRQINRPTIKKTVFQNGEVALVLDYETETAIEDKENLQREVQEVWAVFQKDVENAQLDVGIIRASNLDSGTFVRSGKTHGFVFKKEGNGQWRLDAGENKGAR